MLAPERHKFILTLLSEHGSVRTVDVASRLDVTDETVRRDLDFLEREGLLKRTHGGAVRNRDGLNERPFAERNVENLEAKQAIARMALKLIEPEDSIFVDASSTALQLVMLLGSFPVRVITHSLYVADQLRHKDQVELILIGGRINRSSLAFLGPEAVLAVRRYRVNMAFCSGNGIEPSLGASEINEDQAILKAVVAERATHFVYMADSTKLGQASSFYFAETSNIDVFITDARRNHPVLDDLEHAGVEVITPE